MGREAVLYVNDVITRADMYVIYMMLQIAAN